MNANNSDAETHNVLRLGDKAALAAEIAADPQLLASDKVVGTALLFRFLHTKTGECTASYEEIARATALKRRASINAVHRLEQAGRLVVQSVADGRTSNGFIFPGLVYRDAPAFDALVNGDAPPLVNHGAPKLVNSDAPPNLNTGIDSGLIREIIPLGKPSGFQGTKTCQPRKRATPRRTRLPQDWQPSERDVEAALAAGLRDADIPHEAEKFCNYYLSRATVRADWHRTWYSWCIKAIEFAAERRVESRRAHNGRSLVAGLLHATGSDPWRQS